MQNLSVIWHLTEQPNFWVMESLAVLCLLGQMILWWLQMAGENALNWSLLTDGVCFRKKIASYLFIHIFIYSMVFYNLI